MIGAFRRLHRNLFILLIPIVIDLISLAAGLTFIPFYENPKPSFIVIYEVGLPSLAHILNRPLLANTYKYLAGFQELTFTVMAVVFALQILNSFGKGAYIGYIYNIAKNERVSFGGILSAAKRYWLRFFFLGLILLLFQMSVVTFLFLFFHVIGSFAAMILFFVLRFVFIYFEYSMVVFDKDFRGAASVAYKYFRTHHAGTYIVTPLIFIAAGFQSYMLHLYWSLESVLLFIAVYAYIMTGLHVALMMNFHIMITEYEGE